LRWKGIDFDAKTLSIVNNRVMVGGTAVENDPKSVASGRMLPLPDRLMSALWSSRGAPIGRTPCTRRWRV
ncbi:hypothetical protein ABQF17_24355, partial [Mycolicibacterium elephantis]